MDLMTIFTACALGFKAELFVPLGALDNCSASFRLGATVAPQNGSPTIDRWAAYIAEAARRFGRPEAWVWATEMVRKGGTVNFFGGCAKGSKVELDTNRLHYSEITLKATFHHTPDTVRKAFALIAEKKIRPTDYITGEAPLSRLQQVLEHMMDRNGDIKTAIIPGQ